MAVERSHDQDSPPPHIPRHVAVIMDGNGRWAQARGLERVKGHEVGADSVRAVVRACRQWGVQALTVFGFSTENWRRPEIEVSALMALLKRYLMQERRELMDNNIRLQAIGQIERLPRAVRLPLRELSKATRDNTGMVLTLALSYGARDEIVQAVRAIARDVKRRRVKPDSIDEAVISAHLGTAGLPDPDLLIRTSGELRLSNFLLWQIAYAELYVTDVMWPDFREPQLREAFEAFGARQRRFGKTGAQVAGKKTT